MASSIGPNFNKAQLAHQNRVRADVNTVDAKEASHAAQTGASDKVGKQAKTQKKEGSKLNEKSFLSEAAQKALDKAEATDAEQDAHRANLKENAADVADDIALRNKTKKRGEDDDDKRVGSGQVKEKKSQTVFALDDGDEYEVTTTQAEGVKKMDGKSPEEILAGMPEGARKASEATLDAQIKTKGTDKVADLKDDPKITAVAEQLDLDPAESLKESAVIAPIKDAKNEPPMLQDDPNAERMAKEAAIKQMQSGGGPEAMIAS